MAAHNRKLKNITFDIGGSEYQIQCKTWKITNDSDDPEKQYTFAPDGEFYDEVDPSYKLEATFFADWRSAGVSTYFWEHDGETVAFTLDHYPDIPLEHVRWSGLVLIKAPDVGGDVRTTEETEIEFGIIGKPDFERP